MQIKFQRLGAVATAVFTVFVFTACEDGGLADVPTALTASGELVPFKIGPAIDGRFVTVPFGDPRIPPGTPTENCPVGPGGFPNGGGIGIDEWTAHASHVGLVTIRQIRCAVQFFPDTDPPLAAFDVNVTITSANGDEIFGHADFISFGPENTPPLEIVGGTGRFDGATGWLLPNVDNPLVVVPDDPNDPFILSGTFTGGGSIGEISTVGSNRGR